MSRSSMCRTRAVATSWNRSPATSRWLSATSHSVASRLWSPSSARARHTGVVQAHLSAVLCHVLLERLLPLYTGECRDEMEFTEAESNMNDLVSEYHQ